jgi:hypothetical protein
MAGFNITITDNLGNVIERIESAITECSDFRPLWETLRRPWEDSRETMYDTQGKSTGSPWLGYEETDEADWYVWWKAAVTDQVIESPEDLNHLLFSFGRQFTQAVAARQSDFAGAISRSLGDQGRVRSGLTTSQVLARLSGSAG